MLGSKIEIGDRVFVEYMHKNGTVIDDRGGRIGRWKVELDDGSTCHASSRDITSVQKEEEDPVIAPPVERIAPEDWEKRSKESIARILKKYSK